MFWNFFRDTSGKQVQSRYRFLHSYFTLATQFLNLNKKCCILDNGEDILGASSEIIEQNYQWSDKKLLCDASIGTYHFRMYRSMDE